MPAKKNAPLKAVGAADTFEELSAKNIRAMTTAIQKNVETVDLLTSKVTSLACHVTALETILSEVVKITGVDLVQVNSRIRSRINAVGGDSASSNVVVDIAAALASPAIKQSFL
jgi:hypothetical protein